MSQGNSTDSLRQQAARGGRWTAISAIANVTIQLMQLAALGRLLEPSDFGLMAMMMVVVALATSIADFGVGNYIVQISTLSMQFFRRLFALSLTLSIALSAVVAGAAPWFATYYGSPRLADLLPYLGLVIVTSAISQVYFAVLQRALRFRLIAIGDVVSASIGLVVSVGLAWFGYGVWSLIAGQLALNLGKAIMYYLPARTALKHAPSSCEERIVNALRFGYFQLGERILNFVGWNLDKIIIGKMLGATSLGIYSVAYQLVIRPFSVLNPIFTRVSLPVFSRIKEDDARLRRGYLDVLRVIALISFPVYIGISISAPAIVYILLGERWAAAAPLVSVLCGLGFVFSLGNPIGNLIVAKGRADLGFYWNLLALVVYAVAYFVGSSFGLFGVAVAFVFSAIGILYPLEIILRWKLVAMGVVEYFSAIKHLIAAAAMPLLFCFIFRFNDRVAERLFLQLLTGVGGVAFFVSYLWFTERMLIKSTVSLVFGRGR